MKFTFLGTGTSQGIPVIGCNCKVCTSSDPRNARLRCSLLIEADVNVVIDIGPDFRQQMLREGVKKLTAVVLTHEHMDHLAGLDEVRAFNFFQKEAMQIYATERVQKRIREQYSYIFRNTDYPGIPQIHFHTIGKKPFNIGGIPFQPVEVMHGDLPVLGFRMGDFTYITDANYIAEEEKQKIKDCAFLCLNALKKQAHYSHFSLGEAIELASELNAGQTFLTHISHQMGLHDEVSEELSSKVAIAWDGLSVQI